MQSKWPRPSLAALAVMALVSQTQSYAQSAEGQALERVIVTGSAIKRTDKETPSVVQVITRQDIKNSGYANVEELLRAGGSVDASSITDGAASGFVGGLATVSQRGFGSQATLILVNGRRLAPVGAVDINFGRGSLVSVNTIPRGAIDRVEILKDGASALYGSDAMAGVINYILRKDFQGIEANAGYMASDTGAGKTKNGGFSFGFGNLDSHGFNVFGGVELSKRDPVTGGELKDRGNLDIANQQLNAGGTLTRFTPNSVASQYASYYRVLPSLAGTTTLDGRSVANNSVFGVNYLGTLPGCAPENTVGQGVPTRPDGTLAASASLRAGQCRFDVDTTDEVISAQDRASFAGRATFALGSNFTAYADVMFAKTKTTETGLPYVLTTGLVTSANPVAVTWALPNGSIGRQNGLILGVNHPDNPTRGTATPQQVQLVYRFHDLSPADITELKTQRVTLGLEGTAAGWDLDAALLQSRQDNTRVLRDRPRKSLLDAALLSGSYRFNGTVNTPEAIRSIASDAITEGESTITSVDVRASRSLFALSGGDAAVALGLEYRKEELSATPDANYQSGDYIGLVGNSASGKRNLTAAFAEFSLPVLKNLELQIAGRQEKYSDFGNSTTGKLGAKWDVMPSLLSLRSTVATGFRAPSIAQISKAFLLSFNNFQERAILDPIRCNPTGGPGGTPISRADPPVLRDCNLLGRTATNAAGSIATAISANPDLKPEKSKSATLGAIFSPTKDIDLAIDGWYFERNDEIRVQRSIDILDRYVANPSGPDAAAVVRDPNPATWLPGVPNSGPVITILRGYGNFLWSKTSGIDYDLNIRHNWEGVGKLRLNVNGTYTARFDQKVLDSAPIDRWAGTSSSGIPTTKASARLSLDRDDWGVWGRWNHEDKLWRIGTTDVCLSSTTAPNLILSANNACFVGRLQTFDAGFSWKPMKNLTLAGSVLNLTNDYTRSSNIPYVFNYWDSGNPAQLGRRFNISLSYSTD